MKEPKIIYEDNWLLAVDKPPKLLVVPTPKKEKYTLTAIVDSYLKKHSQKTRAYPVHRLDRDTSGVILYAKERTIQEALERLFKERNIKKTYIAFVQGKLKKPSGIINNQIFEGGVYKSASTKYQVLKEFQDYSKVLVSPLTGRTNQIRIHFKQIGHPLVGERKFAFARDFKLKFRRTALHALSLEFTHPITLDQMVLTTPLAGDLIALDK